MKPPPTDTTQIGKLLFDRATARQMLRLMSFVMLGLGLASALLTHLGNLPDPFRWLVYGGSVALPLIALALLKGERVRGAGLILLWGSWALALGGAPFTSGNRSIGIVALPGLIVMMGWLLSPRQAILMAGLSILALLGISLSEEYAWIALRGPASPLSRWAILSAELLVTTLLTVLSHRLYARRFDAQQHLAATLELVTERSPIMLASVDEEGRYRYVNRNYAAFHGKLPIDMIGTPVAAHLGIGAAQAPLRALRDGKSSARYRQRRSNAQTGMACWLEADVQRARREDGSDDGYYAILRDITAEVGAEERLHLLANHDALTGLPNRLLLADRLRQAISRATREDSLLAVCHIDLDGFQCLNDTWGHATGDQILVQAATRLQACMRATDTVARLGGDEFIVVIGSLEEREALPATVARLLAALAAPMEVGLATPISVSASIGVALCPLEGEGPEVLLHHADQAMLMAKQSGRQRFVLFEQAQQTAAASARAAHGAAPSPLPESRRSA